MGKRGNKEENITEEMATESLGTETSVETDEKVEQSTDNLTECETPVRTQAQKEQDVAIKRLKGQFKANLFCGGLTILSLISTITQGITAENKYTAAAFCFGLMYIATCTLFTYRRLEDVKNSDGKECEVPFVESMLYLLLNNIFIFGMLACFVQQYK